MTTESLHGTSWDVVIGGTGIGQSLLALALSRTGKKILHIDQNRYYGGAEAAFGQTEAQSLVQDSNGPAGRFASTELVMSFTKGPGKLAPSKSYSLTLSPHIIYSQSALLAGLVSSRLHEQLEFQAIGPWWMCHNIPGTSQHDEYRTPDDTSEEDRARPDHYATSVMQKIPGTREDVFVDDTLPIRDKRSLMKFLRWAIFDAESESQPLPDTPLASTLTASFGVAPRLHLPVLALSLSYESAMAATTKSTILRLRRHLQSIGRFGVGFGAVMPKYGGLAEIGQVACRASAVGGAVYALGRGLQTIALPEGMPSTSSAPSEPLLQLGLSDGETVESRFVVGCRDDYPPEIIEQSDIDYSDIITTIRTINIISSALDHLFPSTSEHGPKPAAAVVVNGGNDHRTSSNYDPVPEKLPTYMLVHSADSGECPAGQCVVYASTSCLPRDEGDEGLDRLTSAVENLLSTSPETGPRPEVLWSMVYFNKGRPSFSTRSTSPPLYSSLSGRALIFPPPSIDLAFDDSILDSVREAWKRIVSENGDGEGVDEAGFLRFEPDSQESGSS